MALHCSSAVTHQLKLGVLQLVTGSVRQDGQMSLQSGYGCARKGSATLAVVLYSFFPMLMADLEECWAVTGTVGSVDSVGGLDSESESSRGFVVEKT